MRSPRRRSNRYWSSNCPLPTCRSSAEGQFAGASLQVVREAAWQDCNSASAAVNSPCASLERVIQGIAFLVRVG